LGSQAVFLPGSDTPVTVEELQAAVLHDALHVRFWFVDLQNTPDKQIEQIITTSEPFTVWWE